MREGLTGIVGIKAYVTASFIFDRAFEEFDEFRAEGFVLRGGEVDGILPLAYGVL